MDNYIQYKHQLQCTAGLQESEQALRAVVPHQGTPTKKVRWRKLKSENVPDDCIFD